MVHIKLGYIAIGATPPCPAILDRQPAINVTSNVCQNSHTDPQTENDQYMSRS